MFYDPRHIKLLSLSLILRFYGLIISYELNVFMPNIRISHQILCEYISRHDDVLYCIITLYFESKYKGSK